MVLEKPVQNSRLEFQKLAEAGLEYQTWWLAAADVSAAEVAT